MFERESGRLSTTAGIPVAPSLEPSLAAVNAPPEYVPVDSRVVFIAAVAIVVGAGGAIIANILTRLIGFITNLAYYGRLSTQFSAPTTERLGAWSVLIPIAGAVVVGLMARFGAAAIRGHGIPEVMERVLYNRSQISPKIMLLKPLSAAIAIGTGGPFGAEGPIIATGGAVGSLVGQLIHVTADERKTLLAAGAAAGMAATFGSPVAAVLLAIELLLFEYRPRSLIPVALASATATGVRALLVGSAPVFTIPTLQQPSLPALLIYVLLGALVGAFAAGTTRFIYWIEDLYEELPIHWMWWPALGAVVVGAIGLVDQRTLGVGYVNIENIIGGQLVGRALLMLIALKFISWSIYLGSGTSGGTLAPLFTVGGGIGALLGGAATAVAPSLGVDVHVAALVGMASIFAGASHALLASIVFAFETTRQPMGLLPLLAGCSAAYLVALLLMRSSIMTEKLARRGTQVRTEYTADFLDRVLVRDASSRKVVTIAGAQTLHEIRAWVSIQSPDTAHQGFPVVDDAGDLLGVVTRRDLLDPKHDETMTVRDTLARTPAVVFDDNTLREAADHMVHEGVGRLAVVSREEPRKIVGIISRSDLLSAHRHRLHAAMVTETPPIGRAWIKRQQKNRRPPPAAA
ncbi:MAG: chloride channel protein [bacterium]